LAIEGVRTQKPAPTWAKTDAGTSGQLPFGSAVYCNGEMPAILQANKKPLACPPSGYAVNEKRPVTNMGGTQLARAFLHFKRTSPAAFVQSIP